MAPLNTLFDPVQIGTVTTRNRICVPPMLCRCLGKDHQATEKVVAHYRNLAQGGAGLIIQEATCVCPDGLLTQSQLGLWEDGQIAGLRRVVDAVHEAGCPIFVQLHHAGVVGIDHEPICPDSYRFREQGRETTGKKMTQADLDQVRQAFIQAARRAAEAGYDGVELHGCHRYLLCQFLNSRVNRRKDVYGLEPERFVLEILTGIRAVTPQTFVVGIRLGAFEPTLQDGLRHAAVLEAHGIDFLDISYGFTGEDEPETPANSPEKDVVWAAGVFKQHCRVPVFAVNGIRLPADAERVLADTGVDMVDVGRSMLVDPAWASKAKAGITPGRCLDCPMCRWRIDSERCPGRLALARAKN